MHSISTILLDTQATASKAAVYPEPLSSTPLQASIANYGIIMALGEATQKTSSNITYNSVSPLILAPPAPAVEMNATPSTESVRKTLETDEGDIVAEAYQIMRLIHEIFVEMRRQAAESRQGDYLDQWKALDSKAKEMVKAAGKDLGAGLTGGAFGIVGGIAGLSAAGMATKHTKLAQKEGGADLPQAPANPNNPSGGQAVRPEAMASKSRAGSVADDIVEDAASIEPDSTSVQPAADHNQKQAGTDPDPGAPQKNSGSEYHNNQAQIHSGRSMSFTQAGTATGQVFSSGFKFGADLDRADSQRDEAEVVKAQASAERESEFCRTTSESIKSILDTTSQLVTSRHEISNKIWS